MSSAAADSSRRINDRRRAEALVELVTDRLRIELEVSGDHDAWPLIGAALLSRAATMLKHIFDLGHDGQSVDAATLGRSLYEHVVHLAWLGADPSAARLEEWRRTDLVNRLKADTDARERGIEIFTDADRAALRAQIDGMTGNDLVLANLAVAADKHWAGTLAGMGTHLEPTSFRGLYVFLYRSYSGTAHPSYIGMNHVVQDVAPGRLRVVIEGEPDGRGPFGMATFIFALGLYVAAETLGWPGADDVTAAFDQFPALP